MKKKKKKKGLVDQKRQYKQWCHKCGKYGHKPCDCNCLENNNENDKDE